RHDRRALVLQNRLVRMHTNNEFIAELAGLQHGTCVSMVGEVEAAIDPDARV
ncbi:hypothetical protein LTR16_010857, partial [Cryomyces antarcticus]